MNNSIYEKNLTALKDGYPGLYEKVCLCPNGNYQTIASGEKTIPNLLYSGLLPPMLFYNSGDPVGSARNSLKPFLARQGKFFVLLGMGLGYAALELITKNKLVKLIIVEKDIACLKKALESVDVTKLIQNNCVRIVAGCSEADLYIMMRNAINPHFPCLKEIIFVPLPAAVTISGTYYSQVVSAVRDISQNYYGERGNDPYDTLVGYEQFLMNINEYLSNPGSSYVKDIFKGKPAVVVATGPSLKKNIHLLKEIENFAVIISADASLKILHENDILPHLVTTVERPPGFDKYYSELRNLDKTVFATASFVHPSTLKAYYGPKIFFHRIYDFMEQLGLLEDCFPMGPTTANMAFEVARHMGCNPIILMGNDLCFDKAGQTHAEGFIYGEKFSHYDDMDRFEVPGNYDETVITCHDWFDCIKAYEKSIDCWSGTLINATAGGARIRGSKIIPLQDVIRLYCLSPFYPRNILLNHISQWKSTRNADSFTSVLDSFVETADQFIQISKKTHITLNEILNDINKSGRQLPSALQRQIRESMPHINAMLDALMVSPLAKSFGEYIYTDLFPLLAEWQVIDDRFSSRIWADAYRIKLADTFFASLGQLCISLKKVLSDGKKRLASL